jgi:hypothetical protein
MTPVRRLACFGHGALVALFLLASAPGASAALSGGAGYDYQSGPHGLTWSAPLAFGTLAGSGSDGTLAVYRYHSSDTGWGWSGLANLGHSFGPSTGGRVIGIGAVGDQDYRAWRIQGGPTLRFRGGRSLFAYAAHFEDNRSAHLNQIGAEASITLSPVLSGSAGGALGKWQGDVSSAQGILGLTWSGSKVLQLFGQMMFGTNIASPSTLTSGGVNGPLGTRGRGRGSGGSGDTTSSTDAEAEAAGFLGIRILVP